MKKVRGYRALLNRPGHESTAAVVAEVVEEQYGTSISFVLSDCSRSVTLSFENCLDDFDDYVNALGKLEHIAVAARSLQKAIRAEYRKRNR